MELFFDLLDFFFLCFGFESDFRFPFCGPPMLFSFFCDGEKKGKDRRLRCLEALFCVGKGWKSDHVGRYNDERGSV